MDVAQIIAEAAIEATMHSAKYWDNEEAYKSAIDKCDADDIHIYAEMIGIDSPTDEDIANALTIYHSEQSINRMMEVY